MHSYILKEYVLKQTLCKTRCVSSYTDLNRDVNEKRNIINGANFLP